MLPARTSGDKGTLPSHAAEVIPEKSPEGQGVRVLPESPDTLLHHESGFRFEEYPSFPEDLETQDRIQVPVQEYHVGEAWLR